MAVQAPYELIYGIGVSTLTAAITATISEATNQPVDGACSFTIVFPP